MTVALHTRQWTKPALLKQLEHGGTPRKRVPGGWIDDLAALGKAVWFCDLCIRKFNPLRYGYRRNRDLPRVRGNCDGCKTFGINAMFVPHQHKDGWTGYV